MRFSKLFESDDDHEYWASMPHEHLHAETHNLLKSLGFRHDVDTTRHPDYRGSTYTYHGETHLDPDGFPDGMPVHELHEVHGKLGWVRSHLDTHSFDTGHHQIDVNTYHHPNGSRLIFHHIFNERDASFEQYAHVRTPKK